MTRENFHQALRQRAGAVAAHRAEERKRKAVERRLQVIEDALAAVWQWTNDGHPDLSLLLPILRAADTDAALVRALDELEAGAR